MKNQKLDAKEQANMKGKKKNKNVNSIFSFSGRRFRSGSFSAAMIVVVIAIVVFVNLVVSKIPVNYTEFDTSGKKLYTISETSEKLCKNMKTDVTIYYLVSKSTMKQYPEITKLIDQYEALSSHIKVETKDPELYPTFGEKYKAESSTVLIVSSEKRYKLLDGNDLYTVSNQADVMSGYAEAEYQFNGENLLANAISYVTTDVLPKAYRLTSEGEANLASNIEQALTDGNVELDELDLLRSESIPDDCDCLMIISPQQDLNDNTTKVVKEYLSNGGHLMVVSDFLGDGKVLKNLNEVLKDYGVAVDQGIVYEDDADYINGNSRTYCMPKMISTDVTLSLVEDNLTSIFMPVTQSIKELDDKRPSVDVKSILVSSDSAYLKSEVEKAETSEKEEGDVSGPFDLAVAVTDSKDNIDEETEDQEEAEKNVTNAKLVVYGSSSIIDEQISQSYAPCDALLFAASMGWLCDSQDSLEISSKSLTEVTVSLTDQDVSIWSFVYISIPVVVILGGIVITVRRRYRV